MTATAPSEPPASELHSRLRQIADRARPTVLAREQVLPVLPALRELLPGGALERGTTVGVTGDAATSLALALIAGPSAAGSWVAVVGLPTLGLAATAESGLALERLVLVREPSASSPQPSNPQPSKWSSVVAALVGAFDVVVLAPNHRVRSADARRLVARARERGSVLVQLGCEAGTGLECDVRLTSGRVRWQGLARGHGHLQTRRVEIEASGRRRAARPRHVELWLFDDEGRVGVAERCEKENADATVTQLHSKRAV